MTTSPLTPEKADAPLEASVRPRPWWLHPALLSSLLVLLVLVPYLQVLTQEFVNFDDDVFIYSNSHVNQGLTASGLVWAFTIHGPSQYHPLTWLSHMLDVQLFGLWAGGHKLHNLLLHLANVVLLFQVLRVFTGRVGASWAVAALFGIHPLRVEAVAWVSERKELLCTFFGLWTLLAYGWYVRRPSLRRYALVALGLALALLAKPMLVTLPCLLLLLDFWPLGRLKTPQRSADWRQLGYLALEKLPLLPLVILSSYLTVLCQAAADTINPLSAYPFSQRLLNMFVAYGWYFKQTFLPSDLTVLYEWPYFWPLGPIVLGVALVVGLTYVALRCWRDRPYLTVGWLWFAGTLIPTIGLVKVGNQAYADRYTYVPHMGLLIAVVWLASDLLARHPLKLSVRLLAGAALLLGLSFTTWLQAGFWSNSIVLWNRALVIDPEHSPSAHNNLGVAYVFAGYEAAAEQHFSDSVRQRYDSPALVSLAILAMQRHEPEKAIPYLQRSIKYRPKDPRGYMGMGNALVDQGKAAEGIEYFRKALEISPDFTLCLENMGDALRKLQRHKEAISCYSRLIQVNPGKPLIPGKPPYRVCLAEALLATGQTNPAIAQLAAVLLSEPSHKAAGELMLKALGGLAPTTAPATSTQPAAP